jgi:endonuclease G
MPAAATADPKQRENYLIDRPQYVLSYNDKTKTPNWVCWNLTAKDIGKTARGAFEPDPDLPAGFDKVLPKTYSGGGFDRGHMCNSKDRSDTEANNDVTFYMTNMVPQAPNNNQKTWEHLEEYCRTLAKSGKALYIVAGPHGIGGTGKSGFKTKIGQGGIKVTVPAHTWKVILVLDGQNASVTKRTRTIAVIMPNDQNIDLDWTKYRVSVHDVEELTGYRFFPDIPEMVANVIKAEPDTVVIENVTPTKKKKRTP